MPKNVRVFVVALLFATSPVLFSLNASADPPRFAIPKPVVPKGGCVVPTIKSVEVPMTAGPNPLLRKADRVEPDNKLTIKGCGFDERSGSGSYGKVFLVGLVEPGTKKKYNSKIELLVTSWTEKPSSDGANWQIEATVRRFVGQPKGEDIVSVLHQPKGAALLVQNRNGQEGERFEIPFRAKLEERDFNGDGSHVNIKCSDQTNDDKCKSTGNSLISFHHSYFGHIAPQGSDNYTLDLANGWMVSSAFGFDPHSFIGSCKGNMEFGYGTNTVSFHWRMATLAKCQYSAGVRVAGPVGTSYR